LRYSIDTSAILDGWVRYYPPDTFPGLWVRLEGLVDDGSLRATEEVLHELERKDDTVHGWLKERSHMFVPIDNEIQPAVAAILSRFERLVDTRKNRSAADPFVIALAQIEGCIVVTGESATNNLAKPHIPDVCAALGIQPISLLQLIRMEGWVFG
jgi:hypothetical protein